MKNNFLYKSLLGNRFLPILLLLLFVIAERLYFLETNSRQIFQQKWSLSSQAITHDLQLILIIITVNSFANLLKTYTLKIILRCCVCTLLLITAIDVYITQHFLVRFNFFEHLKFVSESKAILNFLNQAISGWQSWVIVILVLSSVIILLARYLVCHSEPNKRTQLKIIIAASILFVGCDAVKTKSYHEPAIINAPQAFLSKPTHVVPYSENFVSTLSDNKADDRHCYNPVGASPNLILVILESFSAYHSWRYSNLEDWTPELDELSHTGKWWPNFQANGISTEDGLVAILTGEPPIPKPTSKTVKTFEQFSDTNLTIPSLLNRYGYQTTFLTTGNLNFLNKGNWLKKLGFQYIEGHDATYYDGYDRYHFDAAPDEALYLRALEYLDKSTEKPFFLTIETVSTHHPHITPETLEASEEQVFRYADKQLGIFVKALQEKNFFIDGYLLAVSDHRAMLPMRSDELLRFGDSAYSRIPMFLIGNGQKVLSTGGYSQTDLLPSLQYWLGHDEFCIDVNQGIFLPTDIQVPQCRYSRRSYDTDLVVAECSSGKYLIRLDGDATSYTQAGNGPLRIIDQVNRLRLGKGY